MRLSDWGKLENEAAVEVRVILPLLRELGYELEDIAPKYPIVFQEGRKGRKHEADFVLFDGPLHDRNTSLVVIEAKGPRDRTTEEARAQAESYSHATRAPLVVLCDDQSLQLWQINIALDSVCVLKIALSELKQRRGEVEGFLSKDAVISYSRSVWTKPLSQATADFSHYENHELRRVKKEKGIIERRLIEAKANSPLRTRELLQRHAKGAVIVAHSGVGKSTIGRLIHEAAIDERRKVPSGRLSIELSLTDIAQGETIKDYACARLTAYKPGFTSACFLNWLRDHGLIIICDGMDRLPVSIQQSYAAEMRNLLRDFPLLQLFVLSRPSSSPELQLPILSLVDLTDSEQSAMIAARLDPRDARAFEAMPRKMGELLRNPLLLGLAIDHWETERAIPRRIEDLFRVWLTRTLQVDDRQPLERNRREQALRILALKSAGGRLQLEAAIAALGVENVEAERIETLRACDAITIDSTGAIVFQHEAMSDYLRALYILSLPLPDLTKELANVLLEPGSFFPLLLMALIRQPDLQLLFWKRLSELDLELYQEALRYCVDLSVFEPQLSQGDRFIRDLFAGVVEPLDGFFPKFRSVVERQLSGVDGVGLAITGTLENQSAVFSFRRPSKEISDLEISPPTGDGPLNIVDLKGAGLGSDNGRTLGLRILRKVINSIVERGELAGRNSWNRERLLGWFQSIRVNYSLSFNEYSPLETWNSSLTEYVGKILMLEKSRTQIRIDDILKCIQDLHLEGVFALEYSPRPIGWAQTTTIDNATIAAVKDHFECLQLIYRELVEQNFSEIKHFLGFYVNLPVRYQIGVGMGSKSGGFIVVTNKWLPVENWSNAGADVKLVDSTRVPYEGYLQEVKAELSRLSRDSPYSSIKIGSSMLHLDEDFSALSSAAAAAVSILKDDLKSIFSFDETIF
jgi:hypothetical protein